MRRVPLPAASLLAALALAGSLAVVAGSLLLRILHRGPYYPGFDLAGSANGLFIVSTRTSFWEAVAYLWQQNRRYGAPFPYYSALGALVPGYLTAAWPGQYWAHIVTFGFFLLTLVFVGKAMGLGLRDSWILLLAWGASPALLSFSIVGFPWATAFLPHALALWLTLDVRLRRRALFVLPLCLLADELSWHVYELGRTVFVVFLLAAFLLRDVPLRIRAIWLFAFAVQLWGVWTHPTQHTLAFAAADILRPRKIVEGVPVVAKMLFLLHDPDLPALAVAALLSCLLLTRTRAFLLALLVAQVGLLAALAAHFVPDLRSLPPRRFLMIDFYCLALLASLFGETRTGSGLRRGMQAAVISLLVAGNIWQLADLRRFVEKPFEPAPLGYFTLPFTHSFDYYVQLQNVDWASELVSRVRAGETLLLVYNLGAYDENFTNPESVLERVYVRLGHERFVNSVFVFGSAFCRHNCLPIRPMTQLGPFLDRLRRGDPVPPSSVTGYYVADNPYYPEALRTEKPRIMAEIEKRFTIHRQSPEGAKFTRFTMEPG